MFLKEEIFVTSIQEEHQKMFPPAGMPFIQLQKYLSYVWQRGEGGLR